MSTFHERQKSLFNTLKDAEDQYSFSKSNKVSTPNDCFEIDRRTYRKIKHEMKPFRGRESIYKRPTANIRQCLKAKTIPDHIKNPQKWQYYSLSDVTSDQLSDSTNASTALAYLREIEDREEKSIKMDQDTEVDDSIFKKPKFHISARVKSAVKDEEQNSLVFKSTKLIMPEYVVGVSQKKVKKDKAVQKETCSSSNESKKVELKLDHLFNNDEDED